MPALLSAQLVTVGEITHSFLYIFTYDDVCTLIVHTRTCENTYIHTYLYAPYFIQKHEKSLKNLNNIVCQRTNLETPLETSEGH